MHTTIYASPSKPWITHLYQICTPLMLAVVTPSQVDPIREFLATLLDAYAIIGSSALACYDHILTYRHEWAMLFEREWSGATWLLLINRYTIVLGAIQAVAPYSMETCHSTIRKLVTYLLFLLTPVIAGAFSTLRVYALSNRNVSLAVLVLLLNSVPVVLNIYRYANSTTFYSDFSITGGSSCAIFWSLSPSQDLCFTIASRSATIAADMIVIIVTWTKTYPHARVFLLQSQYLDVSIILFRDGSLYFLAMLLLNILHMLVSIMPALQQLNPISSFAPLLQSMLISRFLINLRQRKLAEETMSTEFSTVAYIVGNMGESLDASQEVIAEDESENGHHHTNSVSSSEEQLLP